MEATAPIEVEPTVAEPLEPEPRATEALMEATAPTEVELTGAAEPPEAGPTDA